MRSGQASLFPLPGNPPRRPNRTGGPMPPGIVLAFTREEFRILKRNTPGPKGSLGGYGQFENILIEITHPRTLHCVLSAAHFERLVRYIKNYGPGGPNSRIRAACVPALRRCGIDVEPDE